MIPRPPRSTLFPSTTLIRSAARPSQGWTQVMAVHHHVDHAMVLQELGSLESVRQVLTDRLADHPWPGKADQGSWLGQMDIAQHRIGGRNAARSRIGENDDIG